MYTSLTSTAFILKKNNFKDSDKIVTFLTKDFGKITAIGKFAKKSIKRNLNLLDYGLLLKIYLNFKKNNHIFFIERVEFLENIVEKENCYLFYIISYLNELIDKTIPENENNHKIFEIYYNFLKNIPNKQNSNKLKTIALFHIKLLELLGYKIKTDSCINCGTNGNFDKYSLEKLGFICNKCSCDNFIILVPGTKKVLLQLDKIDYKNIKISDTIFKELQIIFYENLKRIISMNSYHKLCFYMDMLKNGI